MNKFNILVTLIIADIILTVIGVKYLGAIELNPFCVDFWWFISIKTFLSGICLTVLCMYQKDKYIQYAVIVSILMYSIVLISNLWNTAKYLYY